MKMQLLGLVGLTMGMTFLFTPREGDDTPSVQSEAEMATVGAVVANEDSTQSWMTGEAVLKRRGDGHFYANTLIDGQETPMLVETGASFIALTGEDAYNIGLEWNEDELSVVAHGASGPVLGKRVRLQQVELGGIVVQNVDAAIVPDGLGISLLGQSFLSKVDQVRIEGEEMTLGG